eukprot:sb/3467276/
MIRCCVRQAVSACSRLHRPFPARTYYASEEGEDLKFDILEGSLKHVHNHGWTENALKHAIKELNYSEASIKMFKLGGAEIALHYDQSLNDQLEDMMAQQKDDLAPDAEPVPIADFLQDAIKTRLELQLPYYDRWAEALALCIDPNVAPKATSQFAHLIDDIWFYAGDKSTDFNWYTRRATVAAVYGLTELFMLQDTSPGYSETWAFLNRRVTDLAALGENRVELEKQLEGAGDLMKATFIIARNMLEAMRGYTLLLFLSALVISTTATTTVEESVNSAGLKIFRQLIKVMIFSLPGSMPEGH